MRKRACLILALCLLASIAAGCDRHGAAAGFSGVPESSSGTASGGIRDSVTLYINAEPRSFDPMKTDQEAAQTIAYQMYDALFRQTGGQEIENLLARDYAVSGDGLIHTIHLVEGARFHNGDEITAEDAVFSIEYAAGFSRGAKSTAAIESVAATGDYTLEIRTAAPTAALSRDLCKIAIVSRRAVTGGEDEAPVGSGPYRLVRYQPGVQVELARFEEYFRGPAAIRYLTYRIITDEVEATAALQAGEIDGGSFSLAVYDEVVSDPNLIIYEYPGRLAGYVAINCQTSPFDDSPVRLALCSAVDRERILEALGRGPNAVAAAPGSIVYDPARVAELLAEAGIATPLKAGTVKYAGEGGEAALALQECLAEAGILVEIASVDPGSLARDMARGEFQLALTTGVLPDNGESSWEAEGMIPLYVVLNRYAHNKDLHMEISRVDFHAVYDMYWEQ